MATEIREAPKERNAPVFRIRTYDGLDYFSYMMSGAVAGIAEHCVMYPLDTIRTRAQALAHPGQQLHRAAIRQAIHRAVLHGGWRSLYRGFPAMICGAGPSHALHFVTYETAKDFYGGNDNGHTPLATGMAGATAVLVHDGCMTPADVIKQRLQIVNSPYKGVLDCLLRVSREEGLHAFYRSYKTTLMMNVPFMSVQVSVYESCKILMGAQENDTLPIQLSAGGIAGAMAAAISTPLDVVKTRLQTEGVTSNTKYRNTGVVSVLQQIVHEEGNQAIWRGLKPRILFHVPSAAICWGTYESMKELILKRNQT
eukprot:g8609.t1